MAAKPAAPKSERELVWVHVAVIGERRVGKTNLVNRLVKDEYLSSKAPKPPLPPIKFEGPIKPEQSLEHAAEVIKLIIHDTDSTASLVRRPSNLRSSCPQWGSSSGRAERA